MAAAIVALVFSSRPADRDDREPPPSVRVIPARSEAPDFKVLRATRTIHDLATLRLDAVQDWSVAAVTPKPWSGSATVPGAYVDGGTGRFVNPASARPVILEEGSWSAIAGKQRGTEGGYSWTKPSFERRHRLDPDDLFSPFANGGTVLYRSRLGWPRVGAPMIFSDWVSDLVGSSSSNRLKIVETFRESLEAGSADVDAPMTTQDDECAAVLAYLVLVDEHHADALLTAVERSPNIRRIRAITLGAAAAGLFGHSARSAELLRAARRRLPTEHDPELRCIFAFGGV